MKASGFLSFRGGRVTEYDYEEEVHLQRETDTEAVT